MWLYFLEGRLQSVFDYYSLHLDFKEKNENRRLEIKNIDSYLGLQKWTAVLSASNVKNASICLCEKLDLNCYKWKKKWSNLFPELKTRPRLLLGNV